MGLRFQRRIRVLPGVRLNIGKRGVSTSVGVRGASLTLGKRGVHGNVGAPGTGLSYRTRLDTGAGTREASRAAHAAAQPQPAHLHLREDGTVDVLDESGNPLPARAVRAFREQQGEQIAAWLQGECDAINAILTETSEIHLRCPAPDEVPAYSLGQFTEVPPAEPVPETPGFFARLSPRARRRNEEGNRAARTAWEREMRRWRGRKERFEREQEERWRRFQWAQLGSEPEMSDFFQDRIEDLTWPRETHFDFGIEKGGKAMFIDVDLPEIQDLPRRWATVPRRGLRLGVRTVSDAENRRNYARHIHGVLFRIVGEAFTSFPRMQRVVTSGYSQRIRNATGTVANEYLISVSVDRRRWCRIDFSALERVDPVEALAQFDLRRRMTRTGVFTAIEPFTASSSVA